MYIGNLIFLILVLISWIGLYKCFDKAGIAGWKAFVPFYNFYEWLKLTEKPKWWVVLMIVPGVNIIMYGVLTFNLARYFGKRKAGDLFMASVFSFLYIPYLGFDKNAKLTGVADMGGKEIPFIKNWIDPLIFAVVAASVIRTFFLEAFTIPTSSLEKSLMVGDFLFVSKFSYGAKVPQTPLAFPFAHHTMPFTEGTKSYLEWIKLPKWRLPGLGKPKNNDIVVFNYPDGDTVAVGLQSTMSYYALVRQFGYNNTHNPEFVPQGFDKPVGKIISRPVDKREFYVKRCVGIAGDKLQIKNGELFINDKQVPMPKHAQHFYFVTTVGPVFGSFDGGFSPNAALLDKLDIYVTEVYPRAVHGDTLEYALNMPVDVAERVRGIPGVIGVEKMVYPAGQYDPNIFPHNPRYNWNNDNFGPITLPKEGATIDIDTTNICLWDRVIGVYDDNKLEVKGGKIFINGVETNKYTFKQDYYFMMGDNRHNSADSRSWGMVPFDHVVGKPLFIWFSMKDPEKNPISGKGLISSLTKNSKQGKYRWERFFTYVTDDGISRSYFVHFLVFIALWWGISKWRNRKKKTATS
ncbi:MAG: S26 family signal peptidase [Bacteroidia bacterium]